MKSKTEKITDKRSLIIMFSIIIAFVLFCLTQPLYTDIDNYVMSAFVHGLYGEDNYCYYLNPLLCTIIKWLSFLLPLADNMILVFRTVVFWGFCVLLFLIFQTDVTPLQKMVRVLCLWMLSAISVAANFTVVAAFACMTGTILIGYSIRKKWTGYGMLGIVFFSAGVMIRVNVGELFIPFVALNIFIIALDNIPYVKKALLWGVVFFVCIGIVMGINVYVSGSETYREYIRYNSARSDILDYPVKEYDQVSEQLANEGISENEYWCLRGYIQFDTDLWTPSRLEKASEIVRDGNVYKDRPVTAFLGDIAKGLIQDRWIFVQMAGLTFFCISIIKKKKKVYKLGSILVWTGTVSIILFFTFIGRCPIRLYQAILYGAWGCIWTWNGLSDCKEQGIGKKYYYSGNVVLLAAAIAMICDFVYVFPQNIFTANKGGDAYRSIEEENKNVYIWNVSEYNTYMCKSYADKGKLPAKDFLQHNFPAGGWRYGQKSYYDFLEENEIDNLMDKLVNDKNFFVVGDEWTAERVNNHIQEYWEEDGNLEKKNEIDGRGIWEYRKTTPEIYAE